MDLDPGRLDLQQVPVLSIDQIRAIRASNDYLEGPVMLEPASQSGFYSQKPEWAPGDQRRPIPRSQSHHQHGHPPHLSRSSTVSSVSRGSATSDQRLLVTLAPLHPCPRPAEELGQEGLKKRPAKDEGLSLHLFLCERCGRCKCQECRAPRSLPSCWACGQRCLCSAESVVESGTCLCCVKGLFYHCSPTDDEDDCADRPCSCGSARSCARWSAMAVLSLCLPCLCCYPPARLCLTLCQRGYDRATRPGCRCVHTNTVCRKISSSPNLAPFPKSVEKPV